MARNKQKKQKAALSYYLSKRPPEEVEVMPMLDELIFDAGTPQLEGYRKVFAEWCKVDVEATRVEYDARYVVGLHRMIPIVRGWVTL